MHKVKLALDALRVESFDTTAGDGNGGGTVLGRAYSAPDALCSGYPHGCQSPLCIPTEVQGDPTCNETCPQSCSTCHNSCGGTCDSCPDTCAASCPDTCQDTCPPWIGTKDGAIKLG